MKKWLVEIKEEYRKDVGQWEQVSAHKIRLQDGCLLFYGESGNLMLIRAAGTWITIVEDC